MPLLASPTVTADESALLRSAFDQVQSSFDDITKTLSGLSLHIDPFSPDAPVSLPSDLDEPRKRLANAAASLLQLALDPKEYLDQVAMNVRDIMNGIEEQF